MLNQTKSIFFNLTLSWIDPIYHNEKCNEWNMKTETSLLLKGLIIIRPKRLVEYSLMYVHARPEN